MPSSATADIRTAMKSWRARDRVGDRLVEDQQLGMAGQGDSEGHLRCWPPESLPTRWPSGMSRSARRARACVVELRPGWPPVAACRQRSGTGTAACPARRTRSGQRVVRTRRDAAEHADPARALPGQIHRQVQQGGLARAVRADQRHHTSGREASVQSRNAQVRPYRLPSPQVSITFMMRSPLSSVGGDRQVRW